MISEVCRIAIEAGAKILELREAALAAVQFKADMSPVTEADLAANECIVTQLEKLSRDPIVSEETSPNLEVGDRFWLVDPLDGTKDFVAGKDSFVVNIGLVEKGVPILGVVFAPVLGELFWAQAGAGAYKGSEFKNGQKIENRRAGRELKALASGHHTSPRMRSFLEQNNIVSLERYGSALKLCRIAEGVADLYPRFGPTSEWDTAAGHAILNEAGCHLLAMSTGEPLAYRKANFQNEGFIASRRTLDLTEEIRCIAKK